MKTPKLWCGLFHKKHLTKTGITRPYRTPSVLERVSLCSKCKNKHWIAEIRKPMATYLPALTDVVEKGDVK